MCFLIIMSDKKRPYLCDGVPYKYPKKMESWLKVVSNHNGTFSDPIDESPCDHCEKANKF